MKGKHFSRLHGRGASFSHAAFSIGGACGMAAGNEAITEHNVEVLELGGIPKMTIFPDSITKPVVYTVKNYEVTPTEWGKRIDLTVADDFAEWKISSWNIVSTQKYNIAELVGKEIRLSPYKQNPKKVFMEVLQ